VLAAHLDDAVVLEVDTYWAAVGGQDPVALLKRLGHRVTAVHVKDGPATADPIDQVAVGQGRLPIREILAAAPQALRVVELDDTRGDRFHAIADSCAWLRAEGLG
jgi:sugar phosphate isomerase/epimerase